MRKKIFIYLLIFVLHGCQSKEKKAAKELLGRIEFSFENKKYNTAKLQVDSLNLLYRKNIELRKKADHYLYRIEKIEIERNLTYFNALIPKKEFELDSISRYFTFEKNEVLRDSGEYIHNSIRKNTIQTFLKAQVKENGTIFLTNVYCGRFDCQYQSVSISINGYYVSSVNDQGNPTRYSFSDGFYYWTMLRLPWRESEEICRFIANYADDDILVLLTGTTCNYRYKLEPKYKNAIKESYLLALLLKEIKELKRNMENSEKQLAVIEQKIATLK